MGDEIVKETGDEPAAFCEAIALACEVNHSDYALGTTRLFLKVRVCCAAPPSFDPPLVSS